MQNWDDIKYFLEVARAGNITAAAKRLGVNHSTVSRRIQAFEEEHDIRLFNRIPTGYEMTEAAGNIYEHALEIEARNHNISRGLVGQDSRLSGEINITMPHDILDYCLMEEVAEFKHLQPDILLNIQVAKGVRNLAIREADVAIRLSPSPPDYLIGKEITKLQHGYYVSQDLYQNLGEGTPTPIIVWHDEEHIPQWAEENFTEPKTTLRVDDLYSMYAAVRQGLGVAKMPCYLPDIIKDKRIKRYSVPVQRSNWGLWVLSHIDLRHTARVRACRTFFSERLKDQRGLFDGSLSNMI